MKRFLFKVRDSYQFAKLRFIFQKFCFNGVLISYLAHRYNATWRNERAFEVPLVKHILETYKKIMPNARVLEIGNVLSHYYPSNHTVVDKYEVSQGVVNRDLLDYVPDKKYDLLVSISTLEHIGWDESDFSPLKTLYAVKKMKNIVNPGGIIVLTFPYGHNPFLDFFVRKNLLRFSRVNFYKRTSAINTWKQVSKKNFLKTQYGFPYPNANGVCLAFIFV